MTKFNDFLNEQLQDPELKAEYDALEPEFRFALARMETEIMAKNPKALRFKNADDLFEELDSEFFADDNTLALVESEIIANNPNRKHYDSLEDILREIDEETDYE